MTDMLRETIIASGIPMLALQKRTGVNRNSVASFVRGETSLRLDIADKLAAYFGLALTKIAEKE